jgi:DNA-binding response OmpR family regulator
MVHTWRVTMCPIVHGIRTRRILVADDDEPIRRMLAAWLAEEGYEVQLAADGRQALVAAASFSPDLILLDVTMPGIGGLEVARRVRAGSDVPIVMLGGLCTNVDRAAGLDAGADDYLTKPARLSELLLRIRKLLDGARRVR